MTDLKTTLQTLDNQQVLLSVEVPQARVDETMRKVAKRLAKQVRIPGFRPGKAPYRVIVQRFGREALLEEAAEDLGNKVLPEALESANLEPYAPVSLKEITYDPLTYRLEVPLPPETDAGDYRSLSIPFEEPNEEEIEALVQEQLDQMRLGKKAWVPSEEPIAYGDLVTISIKLTVDGDVKLENDDWDIAPDEEDYTLAPEFDAAFIGMSVGEAKEFTAAFPDDGDKVWAGKEGHFEVEIKSVKKEELPELNDELAQEIGEYESLEQLRQDTYEHMRRHKMEEAESKFSVKVLEALVEQATLAYPPAAVKMELDKLLNEQEEYFKSFGFESLEHFLKTGGQTIEEYRERLRPDAEMRLKRDLVFTAIAEQEQMPVSEYEMQQFLEENLAGNPDTLAEYRQLLAANDLYREFLGNQIRRNKVGDLVLAIARGEDVPAPGEHEAAQAPELEEEAVEPAPEVEEQAEVEPEAPADTDAADVETESEAASQSETDAEVTLETPDDEPEAGEQDED